MGLLARKCVVLDGEGAAPRTALGEPLIMGPFSLTTPAARKVAGDQGPQTALSSLFPAISVGYM